MLLDCSSLYSSKIAPSLGAPSPGIALDARRLGIRASPIQLGQIAI